MLLYLYSGCAETRTTKTLFIVQNEFVLSMQLLYSQRGQYLEYSPHACAIATTSLFGELAFVAHIAKVTNTKVEARE